MKPFSIWLYFILSVAIVAVLPQAYGGPAALISPVHRSSFGQPCNRTSRCDSRAWLGCFNGTCDCIKQDEMIFQESIKKCVSKSGERCKLAVDDKEDKNFIFEVTKCVTNATCSLEGICTCGNKFFENENGTCSAAFGHQESCDSTSQCSQYQALQCQDGLCQCRKSTSIYSYTETEPQCVGLAEQQCINSVCTHNATCSTRNECTCAEPFYADENGLCVPKIRILGNCTATSQCEQKPEKKFVCLNGNCNCDPTISIYGTAQATIKYSDRNGYSYNNNHFFHGFYGEFVTQCLGLVDSPCLVRRCTSNAFCSYPNNHYDSNQEGVCKCRDSFTPSKRGTCATGYESLCSTTSTCIDALVCRSSKCLCPYLTQFFYASTKSCISQVGGPCTANSSCGGNAECTSLNGVGHCTCKSGYVEVAAGQCKAAYDTKCSSSDNCDPLASLQCVDQKCKCPTFSEYSSKLRKCVGLSGAKCDVNKKSRAECTQNSDCEEGAHPLLSGACTCSQGFIETSSYTCKAEDGVVEHDEA